MNYRTVLVEYTTDAHLDTIWFLARMRRYITSRMFASARLRAKRFGLPRCNSTQEIKVHYLDVQPTLEGHTRKAQSVKLI